MGRFRLFGVIVAVASAGCWSMASNTISNSKSNAVTETKPDRTIETNSPAAEPTPPPRPDLSRQIVEGSTFIKSLPQGLSMPKDDAGRLLMREYGAVFVARGGAVPPSKVVFENEADVTVYQRSVKTSVETVGGFRIELQEPAMAALRAAIAAASREGLSISPRGSDSAKRSYGHTVDLWASRVEPGLKYWVSKGRITNADANRIRSLSPFAQVPEILKLESDGVFFAKTLDKSIIYSVAPPGSSQHLSMLALDVKEFENARVRAILAANGWFQTVTSDLPHFTYLGVKESELSGLGLRSVSNSGRTFYVPDI